MASAEESITVNVPIDVMFDVITDYESYPDFLPETESIDILDKSKKNKDGSRTVDVGYAIRVVKKFEYVLRMTEQPYESLQWEQVDGPFKVNAGGWTLESVDDETTHATYQVTVEVGFLVPRSITNMLVGQSLPDTLKRFKERAEKVAKKAKKKDKKDKKGKKDKDKKGKKDKKK